MSDSGEYSSDALSARPVESAEKAESAAEQNSQVSSDKVVTPQPTDNETPPPAQERASANDDGQGRPKGPNGRNKGAAKGGNGRGKQSGQGRKNNSRRAPVGAIPWGQSLALVRYGKMSQVGVFPHNLDAPPRRNTEVVIRTERGVELGLVLTSLAKADPPGDDSTDNPADPPAPQACQGGRCMLDAERLKTLGAEGKCEYAYKRQNKILRLATPQDVNDQIHLDRSEREKRQYCHQQAAELGLTMRVVAVEHLLGGERVIFYFTSEARVDFRELVRHLAGQYRTRIEMRQIGARDEARLIADYERCGQQCCCQRFLGALQPVSIRMAKVQKATLDPSKISGRCNRLMCCLRFEDQTYEQLRKKLPKKNIWVRTEDLVGRVVSTQILTQLVRVVDATGAMVVIDNDAIIERNVNPPDPAEAARMRRPATPRPAGKAAETSQTKSTTAKTAETGGEPGEKKPSRRRRRRGKGGQGKPAGDAPTAPKATGGAEGEGAPKKRRRRRRRKPRGERKADGNGPAPAGG